MSRPPASHPTVAIATKICGRATETGVRRHIRLLFGGRTVVVSETVDGPPDASRPLFVYGPQGGFLHRLEVLLGKRVNSLRYTNSGVPFGSRRRGLEAFLREHRVEVILCEFGPVACNIAPIGIRLGIPVFAYFRGYDGSERLRSPRMLRRYRAVVPRLAGVVAVAQFLLDNLAAHGITHPNTAVIPTGVDTELFAPAAKDPHLVLSVGRIIAKKAPLVTLDAFAAVARDFPNHRLEIIGDGALRGVAEARALDLGLDGRVIFHGLKDHGFVRDRLARAQVLLQHSVTAPDGNAEGLPTSIQEAMACGAVVVSTRHAGIPEAVTSGETGMLVEEHDVAGFAEALRGVLADEPRAARLAAAARARAVERFDYRRLHARLEAMLLAAVGPRG
jgi:glycosyltransferase involved in cell wall biosynthesis